MVLNAVHKFVDQANPFIKISVLYRISVIKPCVMINIWTKWYQTRCAQSNGAYQRYADGRIERRRNTAHPPAANAEANRSFALDSLARGTPTQEKG